MMQVEIKMRDKAQPSVLSKSLIEDIDLLESSMRKFKAYYETQQYALIESSTWGLLKKPERVTVMVNLKRRHLDKITNTTARDFWEKHFDKPPIRCPRAALTPFCALTIA